MLVELGRAARAATARSSNCTGVVTSVNGVPSLRVRLAAGSRWRPSAGRRRPRACPAPAPTGPSMPREAARFHSSSVALCDRPRRRARAAAGAFSINELVRGEARVVDAAAGLPKRSHSLGPVVEALQHATARANRSSLVSVDAARAGCVICPTVGAASSRHGMPAMQRQRDRPRPSPTCRCPRSDTSTTVGLAGALAVEQRGRDAARDRHRADGVAVARARACPAPWSRSGAFALDRRWCRGTSTRWRRTPPRVGGRDHARRSPCRDT